MCSIMLVTVAIFAAMGIAFAGYAGSDSNTVGNTNGNAYGYGYSGSYSGDGNGNIPVPQIPQFNFEGLFGGYLDSLKRVQQNAQSGNGYAGGYAAPSGGGYAAPSGGGYAAPSGGGGGNYGYGGSFSGGDGAAVASGSIGPGGSQQTAAVYPENPNNPNVFSRFGEVSPSEGGGSYGVFSSSVSSSSNVDGKPQSFHQASTTINDNGKVSTYTVKNP